MRFPIRPAGVLRRGVAAVEMAFVTPVMLVVIIGVWETGRLIHVQQIMASAARDGARLAAQANIINTTGAYTQISYNTGTPNVDQTIRSYLYVCGITDQTGLITTFNFINTDGSVDTSRSHPYQGLKNDRFRITVSIPYTSVRWTNLGIVNPATVSASIDWQMLVDDTFSIDTSIPGWSP
jgi:Flp pilus assembly protein TadG